jgi:hypothetical protein
MAACGASRDAPAKRPGPGHRTLPESLRSSPLSRRSPRARRQARPAPCGHRARRSGPRAPRPAMVSWHLRLSQAPSAATDPGSWSVGIRLRRSGRTGASPMWLPVISKARISSVSSSTPRWISCQVSHVAPLVRATTASPVGTTGLARMPHAFALALDPGAIDRQVQWTPGATATDVHSQVLRRRDRVLKSGTSGSPCRLSV